MTPLPRDPLVVDPVRLCAAADAMLVFWKHGHDENGAYRRAVIDPFTDPEIQEALAFLRRLGVTG